MDKEHNNIKEAIEALVLEGKKQGLENSSVEQYVSQINVFNNYLFQDTNISTLSEQEIKQYLERPEVKKKYIAVFALQFYYNDVLKRDYDFSAFKTTTNSSKDVILTKEEMRTLLKKADHQYKVLIALAYHFELKRGEILALKKGDIIFQNGNTTAIQLKPREAHQPLPNSLSKELDGYLAKYEPDVWLFEGKKSGKLLDGNYVSRIFKTIRAKAGIHKSATLEDVRDSHSKHARDAGEILIDEVLGKTPLKRQQVFINVERIDELRSIDSEQFDLRKFIKLCEELNGAYANEWYLTVAMQQRTILNHVAPIFGFKTFKEVANNYRGGKSFKKTVQSLENISRNISDSYLHDPISTYETLPNEIQIGFSSAFDTLLTRIIQILKTEQL